jgi:large subunit ribosomal protein L29
VAKKGMQELVDLSPEELAAQELELREELFQTRFKNQMRQLDNPLRIRHLRRQIARTRTLMTTPVKAKAATKAAAKASAPAAAKPAKKVKEKAAKAPAKEKAR